MHMGPPWTSTPATAQLVRTTHTHTLEVDNLKMAKAATGASAGHTRSLYAAGHAQSSAKSGGATTPGGLVLPYFPAIPDIMGYVPIVNAGQAPQEEWRWDRASAGFKWHVVGTLGKAIVGLISGFVASIVRDVRLAVEAAVARLVLALGALVKTIVDIVGRLVDWFISLLPTFDPLPIFLYYVLF